MAKPKPEPSQCTRHHAIKHRPHPPTLYLHPTPIFSHHTTPLHRTSTTTRPKHILRIKKSRLVKKNAQNLCQFKINPYLCIAETEKALRKSPAKGQPLLLFHFTKVP